MTGFFQNKKTFRYFEISLIVMFWILLFSSPVLFGRSDGIVDWQHVFKVWKEHSVLFTLFIINRFILLPFLFFRNKRLIYIVSASLIIMIAVTGMYFFTRRPSAQSETRPREYPSKNQLSEQEMAPPRQRGDIQRPPVKGQPEPVPPYINLLILSVLVFGFDTGLRTASKWLHSEQVRMNLENESIKSQLVSLKHQVSPHFFMNTLNNIYSLIESDKERSKQALMKLSKLMRYILYENENGKVLLSKEFEFIRNYFDLMRLRFVDEVDIKLSLPDEYNDVEIPALLFISYIENAFKYGASYQTKSVIEVIFKIEKQSLIFTCTNSRNVFASGGTQGGIGMQNARKRLDLLYKNNYELSVNETDDLFSVLLTIPLS